MKQILWAGAVALVVGTASADTPWYKNIQHASGTIVSVTPAPPQEAKSLIVKTAAGEVNYVVSEGASVATALKAGDAVTVDYAVDAGGIRWTNAVKKVTVKSSLGKKTR